MLPPLFTPETSIPIAQASWWLSAVGETSAMVLNSNAAIHHVHLGKLGWGIGISLWKAGSFFLCRVVPSAQHVSAAPR